MERKTTTGYTILTRYNKIVETSPKTITCPATTLGSVELLSECVVIVSDESASRGIASFKTDNKIYMIGHPVDQQVGSPVVIITQPNNKIELIGEVISNKENGIIVEQLQHLKKYPTISIATTAQLGVAFILKRDDEGNIYKYPIIIEAFQKNKNIFFYSSCSELYFSKGMSGSPIVQNDKLIGIHFAIITDTKKGAGRIIWDLETVLK